VRTLRSESGAAAGAWLPLSVAAGSPEQRSLLERGAPYLEPMARVRPIRFASSDEQPALVASTPLGAVWLGTDVDAQAGASERRSRQVAELRANIDRLRALLGTGSFVERAPAAVVEKERSRLAELEAQLRQLG